MLLPAAASSMSSAVAARSPAPWRRLLHLRGQARPRLAGKAALAVGLPVAALSLCGSGKRVQGRAAAGVSCRSVAGLAVPGSAAERIEFCGKPRGFTPLYQAEPTGNTASVNAGDYNLYVGGGAINAAFQRELKLSGSNDYQRLHELLFAQADARPGQLVAAEAGSQAEALARGLGLLGAFARVPGGSPPPRRGPVSAVFVDVFAPEVRPLHERNVAMLYVVGPKGEGASGGHGSTISGEEEFLKAVEDLGANAISALREYNEAAAAGGGVLPPIDAVQWCLVSGGVYRHPRCSKADVAAATVRGMMAGGLGEAGGAAAGVAAAGSMLPTVRFAYDEGAFEESVRRELGREGGA